MCPKSLRAKSSRFINHWRSLKYIIRISKELKWLIDDLIEWTSVFSTNCLVWLLYLHLPQATIPLFHLSDHDYLASFIIHDSYILLTRPWFILISFQSSHHYPALSSDISSFFSLWTPFVSRSSRSSLQNTIIHVRAINRFVPFRLSYNSCPIIW